MCSVLFLWAREYAQFKIQDLTWSLVGKNVHVYGFFHLWFLYYLSLYYLLLFGFLGLLESLSATRVAKPNKASNSVPATVSASSGKVSRKKLVGFSCLIFASAYLGYFVSADLLLDQPGGLVVTLAPFLFYFSFFAFGVAAAFHENLFVKIQGLRWSLLFCAVMVTLGVAQVGEMANSGALRFSLTNKLWISCLLSVWGWLATLAILAFVLNWKVPKINVFLQFFIQRSFSFYIFHFPVVIGLQVLLHKVFWPAEIQVLLVTVLAVFVCEAIFEATRLLQRVSNE